MFWVMNLENILVEKHAELFQSYNIIKGFLNLVIADSYWIQFSFKKL